ncbi:MAG: glycosyltransferase, partial [Verrucomicrobia bacterium]|nr:glycosyltransferase [Verrucomicrobiota bacterium]
MDFTIVTPSLGQLEYLECCIASVADQEGVSIEHIVQDGGTARFNEFAETMSKRWPDRPNYRRVMISENDSGMYDAINKGLKKGTGRICAYLNCDEQYLAGALAKVLDEFKKQSATDILYGGFLVVDEKGDLVTAQRPVKMFWQHVATSHLPNFTCATFFKREMMEREKSYFDTQYKSCADAVWTIERLKRGTKMGMMVDFIG